MKLLKLSFRIGFKKKSFRLSWHWFIIIRETETFNVCVNVLTTKYIKIIYCITYYQNFKTLINLEGVFFFLVCVKFILEIKANFIIYVLCDGF